MSNYPAGVNNADPHFWDPECDEPGCHAEACDVRNVDGIDKLLCEAHVREFHSQRFADDLFAFAAGNARRQAERYTP